MNVAVREGVRAETFSEFFFELFSDALLILINAMTFNYRGSVIAVRCALEDLYRHLYYKDHPQELAMIRGGGIDEQAIGLSPAFLRAYLQRAPYLRIFGTVDDSFSPFTAASPANTSASSTTTTAAASVVIPPSPSGTSNAPLKPAAAASATGTGSPSTLFTTNERLYAETSTAVHGALGLWLSGFQTPASFAFDSGRDARLQATVRDFADIAIGFLIAAHSDRFAAFDDYTKSIVLSHYTDKKRQHFRMLLNV